MQGVVDYRRLEKILGQAPESLEQGRVYRFKARGFMDLVVERLPDCIVSGAAILSLAHYFEQEGDLCADPEMTIRVLAPKQGVVPGMVQPLTFQQAMPPIYREVYPAPGKIDLGAKNELSQFLSGWLRNIARQGHKPSESGQ